MTSERYVGIDNVTLANLIYRSFSMMIIMRWQRLSRPIRTRRISKLLKMTKTRTLSSLRTMRCTTEGVIPLSRPR